jgi:tryptophan-rich sensory protein
MLIAFGAASFGAAATGSIFRPGYWYKQLDKPRWRPPDWLFAPVWTVLYLLIALSGWLVWREEGIAGAALPLGVYVLQLLLNAAWTLLQAPEGSQATLSREKRGLARWPLDS